MLGTIGTLKEGDRGILTDPCGRSFPRDSADQSQVQTLGALPVAKQAKGHRAPPESQCRVDERGRV